MKLLRNLTFLTALAMAASLHGQTITPTTHKGTVTWSWSQGNKAPATLFDIYRSSGPGICVQIPAVPPAVVATFPATCVQIGAVPVGTTTFVDQANATTNLLLEGQTYCWVVVAQGSDGEISANGTTGAGAVEVCKPIPFSGPPPAPTGEAVTVQ